jgi:Tfp pilus assembly protein PilX
MSKVATVLLLMVLIALTAVQIVQTWQLRQEVRMLRAQIARSAENPAASSLKAAGAKLAEAAKSAARGDTKKAEKAAGDAIALLEKSAGRQRLDDLNQAAKSTQDFLKQMLKGVYQPKEEKTPSESQPPSRH